MGVGFLARSFDLINVGDLDLIAQARQRCSRLIVGVYSDEWATALTGRPPVTPLAERIAVVSHVRGVDEVRIQHDRVPPVEPGTVIFVEPGGESAAGRVVLDPRRRTVGPVPGENRRPIDTAVA